MESGGEKDQRFWAPVVRFRKVDRIKTRFDQLWMLLLQVLVSGGVWIEVAGNEFDG
jgi:hypothetical protein